MSCCGVDAGNVIKSPYERLWGGVDKVTLGFNSESHLEICDRENRSPLLYSPSPQLPDGWVGVRLRGAFHFFIFYIILFLWVSGRTGAGLLKSILQRLTECQGMVAAASQASPKMETLELPQRRAAFQNALRG